MTTGHPGISKTLAALTCDYLSWFQGTMAQSELRCYLFRTSTKRLSQGGREVAQDERSRQSWIRDKVETGVSTLCSIGLNSATP
jgi:hypothetical protein